MLIVRVFYWDNVTGNLGCGVFRGDIEIMYMIQWICCSLEPSIKDVIFCPLDQNHLLTNAGFQDLVGGWEKKPKVPTPGIQAQHPAPAPHARHDRSMARNRLVARAFSGFCTSLREGAASNVQLAKWCSRAAFCHTYKLILTILE